MPDEKAEIARKHDCPDCFSCQWCGDDRCGLCRAGKKSCGKCTEAGQEEEPSRTVGAPGGNRTMGEKEKTREQLQEELEIMKARLRGLERADSEKTRAEDTLHGSEEKYRILVQNINEYIYSVSYNDGTVISTYHSPRCFDITGYTPAEYEADPRLWFTMIHEDDRDRVMEFIFDTKRGRANESIEHRIVNKNGGVRWVSNTCTPQIDEEGRITRVDGFILDVTERKHSEDLLRKLSRAVEQSPASVVITDLEGRIEYVNPRFTQLTGYSLEEVMGKSARLLGSDTIPEDIFLNIRDTVTSGREWKGELFNRKKNGESFWEYASISPIRNRRGIISHYLAVKEDITERKAADEALRSSQEILRRRNEMIERDLRLAQLIQKALLPRKSPVHPNLKIEYRYFPYDAVGGDYFSFTDIPGGGMGFFIGDVVGHGISAALFLSLVRAATDRVSRSHRAAPVEYIRTLNEDLLDFMQSYFITAIYGYFQFGPEEGALFRFSNAGHPRPILHRRETGEFALVGSGGSVIGVFRNALYTENSVELRRGDRIYLYTDGIPEAKNMKGEILGFDELPGIMKGLGRESLSGALDALIGEIDRFRGSSPIEDDIVIVGFEIL